MPGAKAEIPEMSDRPVPALREARQPLRGRLPNLGRVHRRDPESGVWLEAELAQAVDPDESDDEFTAIERDAREQIRQLQADRRRLALGALSDPKIAVECADIESRLRSAQQVLERVPLAREETARQAAERRAQEEEKQRRAARAAADKLAAERHDAAKQFDRAARELGEAAQRCEALAVELDLKLQAAGERPGAGMFGPHAYENALRAALGNAGVRPGLIAFEGPVSGRLGPLAGPETAES